MDEEPVEVVSLRLVAVRPGTSLELRQEPVTGPARPGRRQASFAGRWCDVDVYQRADLGFGDMVRGPAVVELPEATCVVLPGWRGTVDAVGTLVLERGPSVSEASCSQHVTAAAPSGSAQAAP
jgi:N-methylhydantoinase A